MPSREERPIRAFVDAKDLQVGDEVYTTDRFGIFRYPVVEAVYVHPEGITEIDFAGERGLTRLGSDDEVAVVRKEETR